MGVGTGIADWFALDTPGDWRLFRKGSGEWRLSRGCTPHWLKLNSTALARTGGLAIYFGQNPARRHGCRSRRPAPVD